LIVSYRRFGTSVCYHFLRSSSPSIFFVSLVLLATNLRCVTSQKNEGLICTATVMGSKVIRLPLRCKWDLVLLSYYAAYIVVTEVSAQPIRPVTKGKAVRVPSRIPRTLKIGRILYPETSVLTANLRCVISQKNEDRKPKNSASTALRKLIYFHEFTPDSSFAQYFSHFCNHVYQMGYFFYIAYS
jgi:hypothetical protein